MNGKNTSHPKEELKNGIRETGKKMHSRWNVVHLSLVCVVLGVLLMLLLDCCRPPSEPWLLFGPSRVPLWDWTALQMVMTFTVLQGALYYLPAGKVEEGKLGHNGKCLKYNMNGLHALVVTAVLMVGLWMGGVIQGTSVSGRVLSLVASGCVISLLLSVLLYLRSHHAHSSQLTQYEGSAALLMELVLGREIDPHLGQIDLKHFTMIRIGFMGWAVVDISYLLTAIETQGSPPLSLLLVLTFQFVYIIDCLLDEKSILDTKEFTEEPIGYLMILGEYIWIPFFSSMPVYFLLQQPTHISFWALVPICLLFVIGFLLYHFSNEQKSGYRKNPKDPAFAGLETIPSPSGKRLLVSGWFGFVRHPNYLGDILMMVAWCLPCGFSNVVPYLPAIQCCQLLKRRADEIEESCHDKHGGAWEEYCRRVPYKFVPNVY